MVEEMRLVGRKLLSFKVDVFKGNVSEQSPTEDEILRDDFDSGSNYSLNINCNVVL